MVASDELPPDGDLVTATLAGDDSAYAELIRRHKGRVCGVIARLARDRADLDDLAQEVFVQGYFKLAQYRRDAAFGHWILRIATFKCYDYLRRKRREAPGVPLEVLAESGFEPDAPAPEPASPHLERLHAALAKLKPPERLVITLLELEEHSLREVADLTGWSIANVKVRAFRARAALRKLITS
jgi:RNA polymerase sigma-70 factor (ECF subfamily)